jgi:hypothetical protein
LEKKRFTSILLLLLQFNIYDRTSFFGIQKQKTVKDTWEAAAVTHFRVAGIEIL